MKIIERFFNLPLDYSNPNGEKIRVFARHVIPKSKAKTLEDEAKLPFRKPCFVPCSSSLSFILSNRVKSCTWKAVPDSKLMMRHINSSSLERLKPFVHPIIFIFTDTTIASFMTMDIRCENYTIAGLLSLFYC